MKPLRAVFLVILGILLLAGSASAGTLTYNASLPLAPTNWTGTMVFPQFNPEYGCLDSICVSLSGHVQGSGQFENLDPTAATIYMALQSPITLKHPDGSSLASAYPGVQTWDTVTAFDGTVDFGGSSGRTHSDLSGDDTRTRCTLLTFDLSLFTGTGNISLPCDAEGASYATGLQSPGNLATQFNTSASAAAEITYHFSQCATPARPATWGTIKGLYR